MPKMQGHSIVGGRKLNPRHESSRPPPVFPTKAGIHAATPASVPRHPSRLSGRNPRHLRSVRTPPSLPSFRRKPESTSLPQRPYHATPPVFPAKAGIHVATPASVPRHPSRLSGESRNPRHFRSVRTPPPLPSFRRKPESTPLPQRPYPATPPVFPAKAGIHVATPASVPRHPSRLSGESRNPRHFRSVRTPPPLPSFRRKPESTPPPQRPYPATPPVFPAKAGIHVATPASLCPRVGVKAHTTRSVGGPSWLPWMDY